MLARRKSAKDFAICGGKPVFGQVLHVNKPWVGDRKRFDAYLDQAWSAHRFTNDGPLSQELEQRIAERLNVPHCVAMCNGTVAMSTLFHALELSGEVILPSFTFISSAHALMQAGLKPVFCDIQAEGWNMSVEHCRSLVTDKTSAIVPTHVFGYPCAVQDFESLAADLGIPLLLDAAHAFDCSLGGRKIGSFGDAEIFSFHATKTFHTAEGGAVTCRDEQLADKLRAARNFGFVGYDRVSGVGGNAKMSELSAAMGLTNLDVLDSKTEQNREVYENYRERLGGFPGVSLMPFDPRESNNYWYVALRLNADFGVSRDLALRILHAENVLARSFFAPGCHKMEPYRQQPARQLTDLPNTDLAADCCLLLPGGAAVAPADAVAICDLLISVAEHAGAFSDLLGPEAAKFRR